MSNNTPFSEFIDIIKSLTPEQKESLMVNHRKFGELKELCKARGYIEVLPSLSGIKILKETKEVKELIEVIKSLKPGGFRLLDKKGKQIKLDKK